MSKRLKRSFLKPKQQNLDAASVTEDDQKKFKEQDERYNASRSKLWFWHLTFLRRKQKREEKAQKKARARARAASLGNAFPELEILLVCSVGQALRNDNEEEYSPAKVEESKEMLKSLRSRPWPMSKKSRCLKQHRGEQRDNLIMPN